MLRDLFARLGAAAKAFRLGPATVQYVDQAWGINPETWQPSKFADFQSASVGVYACSSIRAQNLAGLPFVLTRGEGDNKEVIRTGQIHDLLSKVNPFWTWNRLIQMTELALCTWGEGFWVLERGKSGKGRPTEIWWARPDAMRVIPDATNYLKGFVYSHNGVDLAFTPDEVIWFRYANVADEFRGLSPISAARISIEMSIAALASNRRVFSNGYQIAGIVAPVDKDARMTPAQADEVQAMLTKRLRGERNAHSLAVLNNAISVSPLSISPKDAQFIEMMRWGLGDVCRVYKVPPLVVHDLEKATYSNMDAAYKALWTDCLVPETVFIASEIQEQLLPMFDGEADGCEFDTSRVAVLQEDQAEVTAQAATWWTMGVPLNRVLQEYRPTLLPPGGDGYPWGDEPGGAVTDPTADPAAQPGQGKPPKPGRKPKDQDKPKADDDQSQDPREDTKRALARALAEVRAARLERERAARHAAKAIAYGSDEHKAKVAAFEAVVGDHEEAMKAVVVALFEQQRVALVARIRGRKSVPMQRAALTDTQVKGWLTDMIGKAKDWWDAFIEAATPVLGRAAVDAGLATLVDVSGDDHGIDFNISRPEVAEFLAGRAQRFAEHVNETTWEHLKESLNFGREAGEGIDELAERVEAVMGDRIKSSAENIARTETMGALNGGALEAARASGVVDGKEWLAALDGRTRATHVRAHGRYQGHPIGLDEDFHVGVGHGPHPGAIGLPEEDCHCRCSMTWVVRDDDEDEQRSVPSTVADAVAGLQAWVGRP